jgi:type I restriction enzyme, S subunit
MGKYQGYEKYKESGVEWLGAIPEHWEVKRLGLITEVINDINHEMPVAVDSGIPFLSAKDLLDDGTLNFEKDIKQISEEDFIRLSKKVCPKRNDIIYSRIGACLGKARIVENDIKFLISYSCCVIRLRLKLANPSFFKYSLDSELILTEAKFRTQGIGVPDLGLKQIARFALSVPPLDEQESIAHFLDRKTSQIDALIANKAALLEKLDEKRTALISHAVTKGLDRNVPMKDPGVEWLGDIPEHWQIIRLKHLAEKITDGEHISPKNIEEGIPLLSAKDIRERHIRFDDASYVSEQDARKFWNRCKPERGDVLIVSRGATVGRIGFVETNNKFCLMGSVILIKLKSTVYPDFIYFASNQDYVQKNIVQVSDASAQQAIYLIDVKETNFLLPPGEEQEKIAGFLNKKTAEIDRQKAKVKEAIELLKEYRTALITNAVTGKIDVRQVARV